MNPRIVLLEKEPVEAESFTDHIKEFLPGCAVTKFPTFGDFLMGFGAIATETSIIISEARLALWNPTEDLDERVEYLRKTFPKVVGEEWNCHEVPQRLLTHVMDAGMKTPILIYSHNEKEWLDSSILAHPQVSFLEKEWKLEPLIAAIRKITGN